MNFNPENYLICRTCDRVVYRFDCCGNTTCNCGGCPICNPHHKAAEENAPSRREIFLRDTNGDREEMIRFIALTINPIICWRAGDRKYMEEHHINTSHGRRLKDLVDFAGGWNEAMRVIDVGLLFQTVENVFEELGVQPMTQEPRA